MRDRIEIEYGLKSELGPMRVAYRESVGSSIEKEIELDKVIDKISLYGKIKLRLESTLEEFDVADMQKKKFEGEEEDMDGAFEMSTKTYSIDGEEENPSGTAAVANLTKNQISFDCDDLTPVTERVKLEGDEYKTGNKRKDKESSASGASMEIFKSLESLPLDCREAIFEAIQDNMMSGTLMGYPMVNTRIRVVDGRWSNIRSKNPLIFKQCVS